MIARRKQTPPPPAPEPFQVRSELPSELLKKLEFNILRRLDGFLFGNYTGVFYGPSLDLAEVREYQPGDEVRRIDWNVTARTGTVHVRQYREEHELTAWLVVDLSASMNFGTRRVLKREMALEFAATAAAIMTRHGDKVGAFIVSEHGMSVITPKSGRKQTLAIVQGMQDHVEKGKRGEDGKREEENVSPVDLKEFKKELDALAPEPLVTGLEQLSRTLKRRALLFVVSDFIPKTVGNDEPAWVRLLQRLGAKHELIAVRVVDPLEKALPKVGELRLRDPETGQEIWIDTSDKNLRVAYEKLVLEQTELIGRAMRSARVDMLELDTDKELVEPLLKFTLQRRGRRAT
ncbi:MAG: DUF58 domain-containing protein [Trueperaceae bacterium]